MPVVPNHWTAPTQGTVRLNTETTFQKDTGQSSVGVIARDWRGRVFLSVSCQIENKSCVEEDEPMVVLVGLSALLRFYDGHIVVESDGSAWSKRFGLKPSSHRPAT